MSKQKELEEQKKKQQDIVDQKKQQKQQKKKLLKAELKNVATEEIFQQLDIMKLQIEADRKTKN